MLSSRIGQSAIIGDNDVEHYMANQEIEAKKSIAVLPDLKEEYHRALLIEMFDFSGLQRLEDAILRLLIEHFSQAFSQLASLHRTAVEELKNRVMDVAGKWQTQMAMMTIEQLHSEAFLERVQRSADYFSEALISILSKPLSLACLLYTSRCV